MKRTLIKIAVAKALIWLVIMLFPFSNALADSKHEKISSDLAKLGYKVINVTSKNLPASSKSYFIVTASKGGDDVKVKVFDNKYFLSNENGKLEPINLPNVEAPGQKSGNVKGAQIKPAALRNLGHVSKPALREDSAFDRPMKSESSEKYSSRKPTDQNTFLERAHPSAGAAGGSRDLNAIAASLGNGCFPAPANAVAEFGVGLKDTAKILNHREEFKSGGGVIERSREFKAPQEDSATAKVFQGAEQRGKKNPVSNSQKDLAKQINSREMYQYSMQNLWNILYAKKRPENLTPDQLFASRNLERLAASMAAQGKSKNAIYELLGKQLENQFKGNVVLSGTNPSNPWTLKPNGKMEVYTLVNNRDQALAYTAQALTLKNDPIYETKRKDWVETTAQYNSLRNAETFEGDKAKSEKLKARVENLSSDLAKRQTELLM